MGVWKDSPVGLIVAVSIPLWGRVLVVPQRSGCPHHQCTHVGWPMCDVWESACSFARSNHTGDDAVQPPLSPETITQTDLVGDRLASKCGCGWYSSLELWLPSERKTLHGNPRCNTAGQLVSKSWFMDTWTERLTGSSSDHILGGAACCSVRRATICGMMALVEARKERVYL
jgi:hypothetical protein